MPLPATTERVREHTPDHVNRDIESELEHRIRYYADHPEEIDFRLEELDEEWDIERTLQANASAISLVGLAMSLVKSRYFLLPVAVQGFLMQHALQGWCPPIEILRRMGFRTATEIEAERYGLKVLRGDFDHVRDENGDFSIAEKTLRAVRRR